MNTLREILICLGGTGLFLYGLRVVSGSLQIISDSYIIKLISNIPKNYALAVPTGVMITILTQSSVLSSVAIIGLINNSLISLSQAIGLIVGVNLGATLTPLFVSCINWNDGIFFIALGVFPALFSSSVKLKYSGKIFLGIGISLVGIQSLNEGIFLIKNQEVFTSLINYLSQGIWWSNGLCIALGLFLSLIIQSSVGVIVIIFTLGKLSIINIETGVFFLLGANLATSLITYLSSFKASISSKAVGRFHLIFNIMGLIIILIFYPYLIDLVISFVEFMRAGKIDLLLVISFFHVLFNLLTALLILPVIKFILPFLTKQFISNEDKFDDNTFLLQSNTNFLIVSASLYQLEKKIEDLRSTVCKMFDSIENYIESKDLSAKSLAKIKYLEQITDNLKEEIIGQITPIIEQELSKDQSCKAQMIVRITEELESLADYLDKFIYLFTQLKHQREFNSIEYNEFYNYFNEVRDFYFKVNNYLDNSKADDLNWINKNAHILRSKSDRIRGNNVGRHEQLREAKFLIGYSDMIVTLRKIRSHAHNIAQAVNRDV
ncbi:MAG: Na/Pi cotransporter family protein [Bdellovibrionales bacterium]|jgi:phosphate:Na+ symporter|nr:Na/Pi cotransporter family protein [Bdellovibrionales bacterium]